METKFLQFRKEINIDIDISDFNYTLPPERIAQVPSEVRDLSKLLVYRSGVIMDDLFCNLPSHLDPGHFLVFNDTRVIRARLMFKKQTGAGIEVFCLEPSDPPVMEQAMARAGSVTWKCLVGNLKRWKRDELLMEFDVQGTSVLLRASYQADSHDGTHEILFTWDPGSVPFADVLRSSGHIPLPPYIHRNDTPQDLLRYQTIYARQDGSVAAPTAGLHFTPGVIEKLREKGVSWEHVTLHVGAGTFKPVTVPDIREHVMHKEKIVVSRETIITLISKSGKEIVAVGTTAARTLESIYWAGLKIIRDGKDIHPEIAQWDPYSFSTEVPADRKSALEALLAYLDHHHLASYQSETQLMIIPGYRFRMVDGLVTNFHMPGSSLLLLVAALIGEDWKQAYAHALKNDYRFLSYGDACLFFPAPSRI